jgi:copper chaperone
MALFHVPDMTCGGCVSAITAAVKRADPAATVLADLANQNVRVTGALPEAAVLAAIADAGFSPVARAA